MAATPPRGIHWTQSHPAQALLDSPSASTESYISTSSLEYVNSQLVAHGFVPSPGLSLDGFSGTDSDRLVKCLLGMLGQRVEDMSRTEQLSTKLRTLTYDHERLLTMQRTAKEKAANAEKEVNLYKTKLTATQRTLQSAEAAHKQTSTELQRTRTSMQSLRATHQTELKKKEIEIGRMNERWSKIADSQAKLSSVPAGLHCANLPALERSLFKPQSDLESTLEETENARTQLIDETMRLRRLVAKIVNQVQALLHQVRGFISPKDEELPIWTVENLFPMHPPTFAHDTLTSILTSLKDTLAALPEHIVSSPSTATKMSMSEQGEITRLQEKITQLRTELAQSRKQSRTQAAEAHAKLDKLAVEHQKTSEMIVPLMDEEREKLEEAQRKLNEEREKFTRDTVKFSKDRAALEAEKNELLNEKRSWKVQQMLEDLPQPSGSSEPQPQRPPTPPLQHRKHSRKASQAHTRALVHSPSKKKSPKRPRRSATRVSRRSSTTPNNKPDVIPPFETEIIPSQALPPPPPLAAPSFPSFKPAMSILPSFILPPPSPHASLPNKPILLPKLVSPPSNNFEGGNGNDSLDMHVPPEESDSMIITTPDQDQDQVFTNPDLLTPMRRPFPMAKPLAPHMIHAYSPVKPSPLSRILMLSNSPITPTEGEQMTPICEDGGDDDDLGFVNGGDEDEEMRMVVGSSSGETPEHQRMSLAAELGVESPPPDDDDGEMVTRRRHHQQQKQPQLKRKRPEGDAGEGGRKRPSSSSATATATGKKKVTMAGKDAKASSGKVSGSVRSGGGGRTLRSGAGAGGSGIEKENGKKKNTAAVDSSNVKKKTATTSSTTTTTATKSSVGGGRTAMMNKGAPGPGPRRVPLDSAEAPQIPRRKS